LVGQAAEEFILVKGTGFSPYINPAKSVGLYGKTLLGEGYGL
jgi:hypothetical protein